jgi:hypothetical protein
LDAEIEKELSEMKRQISDSSRSIVDAIRKENETLYEYISNIDQSMKEVEEKAKRSIKMEMDLAISKAFIAMESISLDAKNASLKSSNCSAQVDLINKKMENVQLLMKKFELNKE